MYGIDAKEFFCFVCVLSLMRVFVTSKDKIILFKIF